MNTDAKFRPPLRLAFIGGGITSAIGNVHRISSQLDGLWRLVGGVFSSDAQISAQSALSYGLSEQKGFRNLDELIQSKDEFDAVSVLSPTNLHYEHILELITNGIQVVSEKSMVRNMKEALLLIDYEYKFQKKIYVTFNYTAYPMIRELKSRIEENQIGRILNIHVEMPQEGFLKLNGKTQPPNVQKWRTTDGELSSLSLDLGVHTQNLIQFATGLYGESFIGVKSHHGLVSQVFDYVSALGKYNDGVDATVWYGKAALGHRNGLCLKVYGERGSFEWKQIFPDILLSANQTGAREIIDFGSNVLIEASKARYQRFKPGHPTGFIEAFANYYEDLYNVLSPYGSPELSERYLSTAQTAVKGLQEIRAIEDSCSSKKWEEV